VLLEATTGRLWGIPAALREASRELAEVKARREVPNVLVVGEIYVRCDPFSNDFITRQLERRGIRARTEPVSEFIQYSDYIAWKRGWKKGLSDRIDRFVRNRIASVTHHAVSEPLGLPDAPSIEEAVEAGSPYVRDQVEVETLLTIGVPVRAWRRKEIDAVVSVGPLECMPNKIAEAQFCHVAEEEGLLSLTLSLNGDPVDPETLDNFAFEVHQRFRRARQLGPAVATPEEAAGLAPASAEG
jgi:predicted nucleotide-binding protein (sugar kinase/HSP70/actin superfamily)